MRVISTFGRCDICDRRSPLSWQNRWQRPLSVLGSIIATASCTALRSGTSTDSRRCRTRRLASCTRLPSRQRHGSAPTAALVTDQTTDHVQASDRLLSRRSTVGPHCIFTNSFETTRLPGHFDLQPLHCFTDHLCPPSSPLARSTILCASSLELSRDIH